LLAFFRTYLPSQPSCAGTDGGGPWTDIRWLRNLIEFCKAENESISPEGLHCVQSFKQSDCK